MAQRVKTSGTKSESKLQRMKTSDREWQCVVICLFIGSNGNTRKGFEMCSKLTIKKQERLSTDFVDYFKHIFTPFSVFLLLTLNK